MRKFSFLSACVFAAALTVQAANAAPLSSSGASSATPSSIIFVQAKQDETLKQKVKRVWRNLTGTTYDVGCPALAVAFVRTTCTETGKDAQAKCIAKHPLCEVVQQK